jgi:hypothetical protein
LSSSDRDTAVRRTTVPFRSHAATLCPPSAQLAISLTAELGDLDADRVERALTALAAAVGFEPDPESQLRALGEPLVCGALKAAAGGPESLMIDHALERGHGHPLILAVVLDEIARRAGLPVGIVGGAHGHFLAHQRLAEPLVLDPATGRLTDAGTLGTLMWRCGHQVAAELLDAVQPRYERRGDLTRAIHVARLRGTLPFDDARDTEQRLRALTALLN